jgi:hypothetical protein
MKPPIGDPDAKKNKYWLLKCTLYGLWCSSRHWYTKIKAILNQLGLRENTTNPCLFTGNVIDLSNPVAPPSTLTLTLGLYVDNFVYFSEDPEVKCNFKHLLSSLVVTVEFLSIMEWFLGTHL